MRKQTKRNLIVILSLLSIACFTSFAFGCTGDKPITEGIAFNEITFGDHTFDVGDHPNFAVKIGENKVDKVLVNDIELKTSEYIVKNGYFAFAYDNFKEMGLGKHNVKVVFEQGTKEFTLTITDVQAAKFDISISESYEIGDIDLPKATILNEYQDFSIEYSLTKDGEEVVLSDNGESFAVSFSEAGNYKYKLAVTKNGSVTDHVYNICVSDSFEYALGKNYVEKDLLKYFSGTVACSWDTTRGAIKATEYLGISNELINRARYAGHNYLEVVLSTDINKPSYGSFQYKATDKKGVSLGGEFYATDGLQTILIDLTAVKNKDGVTEIARGRDGLPIYIYSAIFRENALNDNVNYAAHAYKNANIWTATDGDGTPWDYRVGDYMELWTYQTIKVKTSLFKQAIDLGYTHVVYEAENATRGAVLYYNENLNANQSDLNDSTATSSKEFENGYVSVAMNIAALANSDKEYVYLAGVTSGKLLTTGLTFTNKPVTNAVVTFNGEESIKQRVIVGESFDMTKFGVSLGNNAITDITWTLNGEKVDMTNSALLLPEGTYTLKAKIIGESGRGSASCVLAVVRPLEAAEIEGELVTEDRMYLWQSAGEFRWAGRYIAESYLSLSAMAIAKAKEEGKNYLEVTAIAENGWLGVDIRPGSVNEFKASCSTFDGENTFIIDLTNITADDGFVKLLWVNEFTVGLKHAEFVEKPVNSKVNYAQWGYTSQNIISVSSGAVHSVNDIEELKSIFDPVSQLWKTFMVAKAGSFAIDKSIVQDAVASGYTKVRLDIIATNSASKVYYENKLSQSALTTSASNNASFTNKRVSITIDITNVASISGNQVYLAGTNSGWLVLEGLYFTN